MFVRTDLIYFEISKCQSCEDEHYELHYFTSYDGVLLRSVFDS